MTAPLRRLAEADLDSACALSAAAGWNQTAEDWRIFLRFGQAWGIEAEGRLAATVAVLPHGPAFASVAMVLTLPGHRRRGYATTLLSHALAALASTGHRAVLDATPLGQPIYARLGFAPFWTFRRWRLLAGGDPVAGVRPLEPDDWPGIVALDGAASGMQREGLLRAIAARIPSLGRVAAPAGRIEGFALVRDGRLAPQIGPVIARDAACAQRLIAASVASLPAGEAVVIDLRDAWPGLLEWLAGRGAQPVRSFLRMAIGADALPGESALIFAPIGPEFG